MNKALMRIVTDWGIRAFGRDHMINAQVRALRLVEEAAELAQALDVPQAQLEKLINLVYARPKGDYRQELGGVLVCLAVLCEAMGDDPDAAFEAEVRRVLAKPPEHFAKRNQEKLDLGLTG